MAHPTSRQQGICSTRIARFKREEDEEQNRRKYGNRNIEDLAKRPPSVLDTNEMKSRGGNDTTNVVFMKSDQI
jgi:hypothetical protein